MSTASDLITRVQQYIDRNGGTSAGYGWYVGVTSAPRRRLFEEHKVNEQSGAWIYGKADSSLIARNVEQHFIDEGCQGGPGGGDQTALYVYAYRINWYTEE